MQIPVGHQTAASATAEVSFTCRRCGHHARAEVVGMGEGVQSVLNAPGTAAERARIDAEKDIARTIERARCPACGRRGPGAFLRFASMYLWIAAGFLVAGWILGALPTWLDINMSDVDKARSAWVVPALFALTLVISMPLPMLIKWSSTDARVRWLGGGDPPGATSSRA